MAKKHAGKNSRAARREDPELDLIVPEEKKQDGKSMVLEKLAEQSARAGNLDILKPKAGAKITKKAKSKREQLKRQEKAENIQSMLDEKVSQAKKRYKAVKSFRKDNTEEK